MTPAHEIARDEPFAEIDGNSHLVQCSCGVMFRQGPSLELSPEEAKTAVYEQWKIHLHGA